MSRCPGASELGYRVVPLVRVIIFLFYPFAKPVAMTLDCLLGKELGTLYTKREVCVWCGKLLCCRAPVTYLV